MMKRREFVIAARRPAWLLAEHAQRAAIGFLKAHRPVHSRISLRHSAMGCLKWIRSTTHNGAIENRQAEVYHDRLPVLPAQVVVGVYFSAFILQVRIVAAVSSKC